MSSAGRAVLWDLDGTLVDSAEFHWLAWQEIMSAEGAPITREQFEASFGRRNASFLPEWLGPGAPAERVERVGDAKEARYRRYIAERGCEALPGAAAWVERLHRDGWWQAVASSAPRRNIEAVLDGLGLRGFFQAIVSAEDVRVGKPDPRVFLLAAERLGVPAARSVVVEDAAAGIEAARRAGMRCIGISRGAPLDADLAVASLADLPPDAFHRMLDGAARL